MRILFLSQLVPYPVDAGPKVRSYHVLQYLAGRGHEITLVAFSRPDDRPENLSHLQQFCSAVYTIPMLRSRLRDMGYLLQALITRQPFLILRDSSKEMKGALTDLLAAKEFDAVHADQLWMAQYALAATRGMKRGKRMEMVLDQHNAVHKIPERLAAGGGNRLQKGLLLREARNLARYEVESCRQFDNVVWVTEEDWEAVRQLGTDAPAANRHQVIPICIDLDNRPAFVPVSHPFRVTFVGGLHWPPNAEGVAWFYREVWPQVTAACPDSILTVIGKHPPKALAAASEEDNTLEVTGYVDDPTSYLAETAVFIVPLHAGGGMRVKILDAWAWRLPVVSTTIGAEGLSYEAGRDVLLADNADDFSQAVLQVLSQPDLASSLSQKGRETVEKLYNWRTVYSEWDQIYRV